MLVPKLYIFTDSLLPPLLDGIFITSVSVRTQLLLLKQTIVLVHSNPKVFTLLSNTPDRINGDADKLKSKEKRRASSDVVLLNDNNDDEASFCGDSSSDESSAKKPKKVEPKKVAPKKNTKKGADVSNTGTSRRKGSGHCRIAAESLFFLVRASISL